MLAPARAHGTRVYVAGAGPTLISLPRDARAPGACHTAARDPRPRTVGPRAGPGALAPGPLRALPRQDRGRGRRDQGPARSRISKPRRNGGAPGRLSRGQRRACDRAAAVALGPAP